MESFRGVRRRGGFGLTRDLTRSPLECLQLRPDPSVSVRGKQAADRNVGKKAMIRLECFPSPRPVPFSTARGSGQRVSLLLSYRHYCLSHPSACGLWIRHPAEKYAGLRHQVQSHNMIDPFYCTSS